MRGLGLVRQGTVQLREVLVGLSGIILRCDSLDLAGGEDLIAAALVEEPPQTDAARHGGRAQAQRLEQLATRRQGLFRGDLALGHVPRRGHDLSIRPGCFTGTRAGSVQNQPSILYHREGRRTTSPPPTDRSGSDGPRSFLFLLRERKHASLDLRQTCVEHLSCKYK